MSSFRVTVVVVSFNTRDKLAKCLRCIEPEHEIIVVDNNSSDGSADMVAEEFPAAKLIRNKTNRGFGSANNLGIDAATRELILLLNSDAYAEPGAIDRMAKEFADPTIAAAGGQLLNPDGTRQSSSAERLTLWAVLCEQLLLEKLLPNSKTFSPYWNSHRLGDKTSVTAQVMGACLMMRRQERFDERFFLYCEDTELCRRLAKHGKILYVPEARFTHDLGSSSASKRWLAIARYNRGKEMYLQIHHGQIAMSICWILDRTGALLRLIAWSLASAATMGTRRRFRDQAAMFWRVLTAPVQGPPVPLY